MMCMRCWRDAYDGGHYGGCGTQAERYAQLLEERKGDPCTPEQQAGEWWDTKRKVDTRTLPECSICRRRHGSEVVHACE